MEYAVRVLSAGSSLIRGPEVFWMSHWNEDLPIAFNMTLIEGDGMRALVNTTPPDDTHSIRRDFPRMRYLHDVPDGDLSRRPEHRIDGALASVGLTTEDITHILLTPLELYTTGTLHKFTKAQICMTKRGWIHFHVTHDHPHDSRWRSFPKETLVNLITDDWDRVRLLDDEDEIAPGLRSWWSGAHHRESMVVEVDTATGIVAISDSFFYYENVEDGMLLGLCENMYEALACNDRVLKTAQHIVPIHDPKVFERYRDGVITP